MIDWIIISLVSLNIFQLIFWSWQNHKLVNKLMCRDFAEYSLITNGPPKVEKPEEDPNRIAEEEAVLMEVNSLFKGT